ncbi:MAG: hypothetical protein WCP73_10730, partial [Eubacteriales bacterium]
MLRNKNVIIEKATHKETGLDCILLFDEFNGVCESLNEDETHKVSFESMLKIVYKIHEYQQDGYSFRFNGFKDK